MFIRGACLACLALLLAACGGNTRAPVEDRNARAMPPEVKSVSSGPRVYRVQGGDTLYAIAFRYGLDYRGVAAANRIPAPYTIYIGQEIVLREASPITETTAQTSEQPTTQTPAPESPPPRRPQPIIHAPSLPPATHSGSDDPPAARPASPIGPVYTGAPVTRWLWPASGRVTRGYSGNVHKGIDIAGKRGDPVVAVAPGKVVYAGSGIVGFGELLIVKHNEEYLSAYGHNDRLLVSEGDVVSAGQAIAHRGSSGTDTVKLHFEIRRKGKPIDPQRVLPRR